MSSDSKSGVFSDNDDLDNIIDLSSSDVEQAAIINDKEDVEVDFFDV